MKIAFSKPSFPRSGALVVEVLADRRLTATAAEADKKTGGAIKRAMAASRFKGEAGDWLEVLAPSGLGAGRVVLIGLGKADKIDGLAFRRAGGKIVGQLALSGEKSATVVCDSIDGMTVAPEEAAAQIACGARLASYRFDKYRTKEKPAQKPSLEVVTVASTRAAQAARRYAPMDKVNDGVFLTRDLVSEPANVLFPASLARECRKLGRIGINVEVLGEARMRKLGMGALLGVGQGSAHESQLVVMHWRGGPQRARPVAFVGKGVTFDSGGISIKPASGMEEMKWDMGGAGTVIGLMKALAGRKAKVNAVGVVGLVENMPSGGAQRPGDVVTSMSGQTIEVINTDAEGRLVLADALWYTKSRFNPRFMIDLATLTGAIIISLGHEHAGLFANDDELAERLIAAGMAENELVWRLPLGEAYDKMLDSNIADMQNIGGNRAAGSITAAQFLKRFVDEVPWAHLDIAGMAWEKKGRDSVPKGGSGFGVRLLDRLVADYYEGK